MAVGQVAERKSGVVHDVTEMQQVVSLITREMPCHQYVCELEFGVNVTDLDFWDPN